MAAADKGKGIGGIGERAAEYHGGGAAARVNNMHGIGMLGIGRGTLTDYAKLAVNGDMNALGQIVGAKNGQAYAKVNDHAVGEFLRDALCYKGFNHAFFHFICPP